MFRFSLITLLTFSTFAQTTLSGNIGGMVFEPTGNPYIISSTITVQENKTATIKSGCIFLFKSFTGLVVNGSITVAGTVEKQVVFTSINDESTGNDTAQLPNPFDWNGIQIQADAGKIRLEHLIITYSVYGIKSFKSDLCIVSCIFRQNGQYNLAIKDKVMPVVESIPYSYSFSLQAEKTPFAITMKKMAVPVVLGTAGVVTGVGGAYFYCQKKNFHREYDKAVNQVDFDRIRDDESEALTRAAIFSAASALCVTSAAVLFTTGAIEERKRKRRSVNLGIGFGPASFHVTAYLKG